MKKIVGVTIFFFLLMPLAWSLDKTPTATSGIVEAGNKFCPVSGDKVSGKNFVEYQGKRYGLCCKMCANKFNKDPQKFIAKMAEQEANPSAAHANPEHMH